MLTRQVMRKVVAIAAVVGLIAGVYIFVVSFFGLTMDKLGGRVLPLHAGIFALAIPLVVVERGSKGVSPFRGKPRWALRSMQILFLFFVAIFFAFLSLSHAASPKSVDGQYVLDNHGKIVGHLSEADYFFLKGWELRLFAAGWMLAYVLCLNLASTLRLKIVGR
jgi:hypothetical protein